MSNLMKTTADSISKLATSAATAITSAAASAASSLRNQEQLPTGKPPLSHSQQASLLEHDKHEMAKEERKEMLREKIIASNHSRTMDFLNLNNCSSRDSRMPLPSPSSATASTPLSNLSIKEAKELCRVELGFHTQVVSTSEIIQAVIDLTEESPSLMGKLACATEMRDKLNYCVDALTV